MGSHGYGFHSVVPELAGDDTRRTNMEVIFGTSVNLLISLGIISSLITYSK